MNQVLQPMKQLELPSELNAFENESCVETAHKRLFPFLVKNGYPKLALAVLSLGMYKVSDMVRSMTHQNHADILITLHTNCPVLQDIMYKPRLTLHGLSNTSIVHAKDNDHYLLNVRIVNYVLDEMGRFLLPKDALYFETHNLLLEVGPDLKTVLGEKKFEKTMEQDCKYRGVEDIRLIAHRDKFYCMGTICHDNKLMMTFGEYDPEKDKIEVHPITSPYHRTMEKNWCMFEKDDEIQMVYQWAPLEIGKIKDARLEIVHRHDYKWFFLSRVKGSSCGVVDPETGLLWFLVHFHSDETPRQYYHMFVVMDSSNYEIVKVSSPFLFEKARVQFGMGLIVEKERVIITYTIFDRDARVASYDKAKMLEMLFGDNCVFTRA